MSGCRYHCKTERKIQKENLVAVMSNLSRHLNISFSVGTKFQGAITEGREGSGQQPTVRPILINLSGMYGFEIAHCVAAPAVASSASHG